MNNNIENLCIYFIRLEMDAVILMFCYCQFKFFIFCSILLYIFILNKLPIYLLTFNLPEHCTKDIKSNTNFLLFRLLIYDQYKINRTNKK